MTETAALNAQSQTALSERLPARRGRPRKEDANARIDAMLDVAAEIFTQEGFAATMEGIAAAAKVSKRTLYAHFPDKLRLFEAVLSRLSDNHTSRTLSLSEHLPLREALIRYGMSLRDFYARPMVARLSRLMQKERERFPEIDRVMWDEFTRDQIVPLKIYFDTRINGQIRDVDTMLSATAFARIVIGEISKSYIDNDTPPGDEFKDFLVAATDLMLNGLLPHNLK